MKRYLPHLLGALPLLAFGLLHYGLDFNGLYGQDAHEYYRFTKVIYDFLGGGDHPGSFYWPVNYPVYGALLAFIVGKVVVAMQLLSALALAGSALLLYRILLIVHHSSKEFTAVFVLLVFLLSPLPFTAGFLVMSDMLGVFFVLLSVYALLRMEGGYDGRFLLLFAFAATSAIMTRFGAIAVLLPLGLRVVYLAFQNKSWLYLLLSLLLAGVLAIPHFFFHQGNWADFLEGDLPQGWNPLHLFHRRMENNSGQFVYPLPNLIYCFYHVLHPGYLFFGGLALFFVKKKDFSGPVATFLLASVLTYALLLGGMPFQNKRFLLLTFPVVLILLFPAVRRMWSRVNIPWQKGLALAGVAVIQMALIVYVFLPIFLLNRLEQEVAAALKQQPGRVLYVFGMDQALKSYGVPQKMQNLWVRKYEDFEPGALVLFNEERFARQWEGRNPMVNWKKINQQQGLDTVMSWKGGWRLFRMTNDE